MSERDVAANVYLPLTEVPSPESVQHARVQWRDYAKAKTVPNYTVGVAATITADPIEPFLGSALLRQGRLPNICLGPYNRLFQICLEGEAAFERPTDSPPLDAILLYWRIDELMAKDFVEYTHGDADALERALSTLDEWAAALRALRGHFPGALLVNTPPFPQDLETDLREINNPAAATRFHHRISEQWLDRVSEMEGVDLIDADALQRDLGASRIADMRKWLLYRQPYTEAYWLALAEEAARILYIRSAPSKKCIAVDCDNTLWGGVLGEDGLDGLDLGEDFPGSAYRMFQRQLVELQRRGVLIALVSKNNEADVWEVFDKHDAMVLKREHVAAWRINWNPKPDNLRAIAKELNIAADAIVFVDDQPAEIAEVQFQSPEIATLLVPEEPAELPLLLRRNRLFDRLDITHEDRHRTTMIQANRARNALEETYSRGDFLASLQLKAHVQPARQEHLNRVTQLINKTNQFNLTTQRRTSDEVSALWNGEAHHIYVLEAADRFGEYGIVGVAIVHIAPPHAQLDTFLMSCRILGRELETAFLAAVGQDAATGGASELEAEFLPTPSNAPATDFLPKHDFKQTGETWRIRIESLPKAPPHIELFFGGIPRSG